MTRVCAYIVGILFAICAGFLLPAFFIWLAWNYCIVPYVDCLHPMPYIFTVGFWYLLSVFGSVFVSKPQHNVLGGNSNGSD